MKKEYINPLIKVEMFLAENIITASGGYADKIKNNMGVSENGLTETSYGSLFGSND